MRFFTAKPGSVAWNANSTRRNNPAVRSSTSDRDTWATSEVRRRPKRAAPKVSPLRAGSTSVRLARHAGASPKIMVVNSASSALETITRASGVRSSRRASPNAVVGSRTSSSLPNKPPPAANARLSVSSQLKNTIVNLRN